ncbi:MAG: hypothetical protein GC134_06030 [Proteobacteria bacterium]|nr:hypothetical protein [Pseudomonadota bacterium]
MTHFLYTSRNGEAIADLRKATGIAPLDVAVTAALDAAKDAMKATCAEYLRQVAEQLKVLGVRIDRVILPVFFGTSAGETAFRASRAANWPFRLVSLNADPARPLPADVMPPKAERPQRTERRRAEPAKSPLGNKTAPDSKARAAARKRDRSQRDQEIRNKMKGSGNGYRK